MTVENNKTIFGRWLMLVLLLFSGMAFAQQRIGQMEFVQGLATAQGPGNEARFLVRGEPLFEGDVVTTTDKGYAVLALADSTKITLRPGTSFAVDKFAHDKGEESAVMRLIKGGLRAVTGLIGKRNPGGVNLNTVTATIGIRGTSFDARLCGEDCRREEFENRPRPSQAAPRPPADTVIARVVRMTGEATATQAGQAPRRLIEGSPLLVGDEIRTNSQSNVVIGFRDQSRVSLEPQTVFRVDGFSYGRTTQADNFAVRILKGGLRMFTGLIGKKNPAAVNLSTIVATIGIRGTGMDISCEGPCAGAALSPAPGVNAKTKPPKGKAKRVVEPGRLEGLFVHTWDGRIYLSAIGKELDVAFEQVGFVGSERVPRLLAVLPDFMKTFSSPRPDEVDIDWDALFGSEAPSGADGLYALVRDGYIFLQSAGGRIDLGPGEAGYVGEDGKPRRLQPVPGFLADDPFPIPELFNIDDPFILQLFGVTLGQPGQEICEIH